MKKNKNENVKDIVVEETESTAKNQPARGKEKEKNETLFKKVLYGYDPEEVASYIDDLNNTYESAARMQEAKLSSIKEELVLANRERDFYSEKYSECNARLDKLVESGAQAQSRDNSAEYEETIAALRKKLELAEKENENLRQAAQSQNETKSLEYTDRIAALEKEKAQLSQALQTLRNENGELTVISEKYSALFDSYNSVLSQYELLKSQLQTKEEELKALGIQLEDKSDEIKSLYAENEDVKKLNAELEVKHSVLEQRAAENEEEIVRLKDVNKQQAFECAEKINALENEHARERLDAQKELKLHSYYIEQAQLTLTELTKQMEQIKGSLE